MARACGTWLIALATSLAAILTASGAELDARLPVPAGQVATLSTCRTVWRCDSFGCQWHKICPRTCPDRYSCWSLYGAYAPYGGVGFWGAFTMSGFH